MQILESFGLMASDPGLPVQMFCFSRTFSTETTRKGVFHFLSNRIFQKHFVNGKQPQKALSLTTIRYKKDVEDSEEEGGGENFLIRGK